jgi:hypothetical protein
VFQNLSSVIFLLQFPSHLNLQINVIYKEFCDFSHNRIGAQIKQYRINTDHLILQLSYFNSTGSVIGIFMWSRAIREGREKNKMGKRKHLVLIVLIELKEGNEIKGLFASFRNVRKFNHATSN